MLTLKLSLTILFIFLFNAAFASAFEFNGTVLDIQGQPLNNSLVNITIRNQDFSVNGYNSTTTNESGWFNISVEEVPNAFYEFRMTWRNLTTNTVYFVGQNVPAMPSQQIVQISGTSFYLKEAGTINITAINST